MVCEPLEAHLGRPQDGVGFGKFGKVALAMWKLAIGECRLHNWAICTPLFDKVDLAKY